jgi:hypothetical protein
MGHLKFLLRFCPDAPSSPEPATTSLENATEAGAKIAVNARGRNAAESILFRHEMIAE